jgi:hypothetical protein
MSGCTICARGEQFARAVRTRWTEGTAQNQLAREYGVARRTVFRHLTRCIWGQPNGALPPPRKEPTLRAPSVKNPPPELLAIEIPAVPRSARAAAHELFKIGWERLHRSIAANQESNIMAYLRMCTTIQERLAASEPTIDELERMKTLDPVVVAAELERIAAQARAEAGIVQ